MSEQKFIVYDVETQKTFAEVGGFNNQAALKVSYLGLYSYTQDKYFGFFEDDMQKLERILLTEKPTIIGFNSISFDNNVVQPYFKQLKIGELPQIDILAEIFEQLGFRMKLESVAQATLGEGKSGSGLDAIRYYREGNNEALARYCLDDVRITKDLYDYGKRHGYILYTSGGDVHTMNVSWADEQTITDKLKQAHTEHKQVEVNYLQMIEGAEPERFITNLDIISVSGFQLEVFCHRSNATKVYDVRRILKLKYTGEQYAYQDTFL